MFTRSTTAMLLVLSTPVFASQTRTRPSNDIVLQSAIANGNGCPNGIISANLTEDDSIVLTMSPLLTSTGQNVDLRLSRANCNILLDFSGSQSQIALEEVDFDYDARLRSGSTATVSGYSFVQSSGSNASLTRETFGTEDRSGSRSLSTHSDNNNWTSCSQSRSLVVSISSLIVRSQSQRVSSMSVTPKLIKLRTRNCAK